MNKPKNQHWVPQFYLKGFSTPESRNADIPKIWFFSKNDSDGTEKLTNIRNICAKRYLYSPRDAEGQRSWEIDEKLESLESTLAQVWPQISSGFVDLSNETIRKSIALFLTTTHVRHPSNQETLKTLHTNIVEMFSNLPKKPDDTPNVDSYTYKGKTIPINTSDWHRYRSWTDDDHHRFFTETIRTESGSLAKTLLEKRWSIVFSEEERFITSDKPVVVLHESKKTFGLHTPGIMITFPLSPTRILMIDDDFNQPDNQYYSLRPENTGGINWTIWHESTRFLLTGRPVPEVLQEIITWAERKGRA